MKRLLFVAVTLLILAGCSDKNNVDQGDNPFLPIADLVIPREAYTGEEVTLLGRGFNEESVVYLRANEGTQNIRTIPGSVDNSSITFTVPSSLVMGFYVVVLRKDGNYHKIGGINIKSNNYLDEDFELYALAGNSREIYPASVSKQLKGQPLVGSSTMLPECYFGSVLALPNGRVYYSGFYIKEGSSKLNYLMSYYDMHTKTNTPSVAVAGFFAMGEIDGVLHILKTQDNTTYTLFKSENGSETLVQTFDFSSFGSLPIYENDRKFDFHASSNSLLVSGNMGKGTDMAYAAFTLNIETGAVTQNGDNGNFNYWYALMGEKLYCFACETNELVSTTKVLLINDINRWTVSGIGATLIKTIDKTKFETPVYSPKTEMIYGLDDASESSAVLVFNPKTGNLEAKKWVNPGVAAIFYAVPVDENITE